MKELTLNFYKCKYIMEIHKELKEKFNFPNYYGNNLDALWDCLDNYCDYPLAVHVKGLSSLPHEFDEYIEKMISIFRDVEYTTPNIMFDFE